MPRRTVGLYAVHLLSSPHTRSNYPLSAGNTRVVGQKELTRFREELSTAIKDPYTVVLRQKKLPMGLLTEGKEKKLKVRDRPAHGTRLIDQPMAPA